MIYHINYPEDNDLKYDVFRYPAGEAQVRLKPEAIRHVRQAKEIWVTARINTGEIMELALLTSAIVPLNNMAKLVLILPYMPYSRADRAFVEGDCLGSTTFAFYINELGYDEVRTLDIHSSNSCKYDSKQIFDNMENVDPKPFIERIVNDKTTILLPDRGAKRYDLNDLGIPVLQCDKLRNPSTGALSGFKVPQVYTDNVLIVDDICDGGGTFVGIAKELKKQNKNLKIYLYVTHGIFSKGFDELAQYFTHIYMTNSFKSQYFIFDPPEGLVTKFDCEDLLYKSEQYSLF